MHKISINAERMKFSPDNKYLVIMHACSITIYDIYDKFNEIEHPLNSELRNKFFACDMYLKAHDSLSYKMRKWIL